MAIDLKQPKAGGAGEALVGLTLDEALRAEGGLPVSPAARRAPSGSAVVSIGRGGRDADQGRRPISPAPASTGWPGFSKPPGKPGRLSFALIDGGPGNGIDLRDIVLDAAPAVARGNASISQERTFERAELSMLKLSPGDDMRVVLERSGAGYRVNVKGAVADARPFLRSLSGGDTKPSGDTTRRTSRPTSPSTSSRASTTRP